MGLYFVWSADRRTEFPAGQERVEIHRVSRGAAPRVKQAWVGKHATGGGGKYFALAALLIVSLLAYKEIRQAGDHAGERAGLGEVSPSRQVFLQIKNAYSDTNSRRPGGMIALSLENLERAQEGLAKLRDSMGEPPNPQKPLADYVARLNGLQAELADTKSYLLTAWARGLDVSRRAENYLKEAPDSNESPQAVLSELEQSRDNLIIALEKFRLARLHFQEVERETYFFPDPPGMDVIAIMGIIDNISKADLAAKTSHDETAQLLTSIKNSLGGHRDQKLDPDALSRSDGVLLVMPRQGSPAPTNRISPHRKAFRLRTF